MKKIFNVLLLIFIFLIISGCEKNKVTFKYNCEGIEDYVCNIVNGKINCKVETPTCYGKEFNGWYEENSKIEIDLKSRFDESTILYAHWKEIKKDESSKIENDEVLNVITDKKEVKNNNKTNNKKYTISFNSNGGTGGQTKNVSVKYNQKLPSISKTIPVKNGYIFMGWFDNVDYVKGEEYYNNKCNSTKKYNKNNNLVLYAGWKEESIVNYYQGDEEGFKLLSSVKISSNNKIKFYKDFNTSFPLSNNKWEFAGWSLSKSGTKIDYRDGEFIKEDKGIDLYALGRRTFVFYTGKNPIKETSRSIQYYNSMDNSSVTSIEVPKQVDIPGWTFIGYRATTTASSKVTIKPEYAGNNTLKPKASNLTALNFRSIYKRTITIKYDSNGGSGKMNNQTETQYYNCGSGDGKKNNGANVSNVKIKVSKNSFTKSGVSFVEWNTKKDGTGVSYKPSDIIEFSKSVDEINSITLYAIWKDEFIITNCEANMLTTKSLKLEANKKVVSWTSSDTNLASVYSSGVVLAKKEGPVIITAKTENGLTVECKINITQAKIVLIGNSKTYRYPISDGSVFLELKNIFKDRKIDVKLYKISASSSSLLEKVTGIDDDTNIYNPKLDKKKELLREGGYDIAILQESFPNQFEKNKARVIDGITKTIDLLKENNPNIIIYIRQSYIKYKETKDTKDEDAYLEENWKKTQTEICNVAKEVVDKDLKELNLNIIKDGLTLLEYNKEKGYEETKKLYKDNTHLKPKGAYMLSACIYQTLTTRPANNITYYTEGLSKDTYNEFLKIANTTCK